MTIRTRSRGFFADYAASKGPAEVEEASDAIQRPLGYVLARALQFTPISANAVTVGAMIAALGAGACFFLRRPELAAALILASAVLDSSDGQLARMRKSSSLTGRMLDGTSDMVGALCIMSGATWHLVAEHGTSTTRTLLVVAACFVTGLTSSYQFSTFDHYKNVWLRMTVPGAAEPDDSSQALARRRAAGPTNPLLAFAWSTYVSYLSQQSDYVARFDPWTRSRALPPHDPVVAERYRREHAVVMRVWTSFFGFGTMLIGIAIAAAFNLLAIYVVFRLVVLNLIFYGWLRKAQRRASRASFESETVEHGTGAALQGAP